MRRGISRQGIPTLLLILGPCFDASAQLSLRVTAARELFIENLDTSAIRFDGYSLQSPSGGLEPEGWTSFEKSFVADPLTAIATLGIHGFAEANPTEFALSELSAGTGATLQPGTRWSIGHPFRNNNFPNDVIFQYTDPDGVVGGGVQQALCIRPFCIPEPSSFVLAAVGVVAMHVITRRQRRKHTRRPPRAAPSCCAVLACCLSAQSAFGQLQLEVEKQGTDRIPCPCPVSRFGYLDS